MCICDKRLFHLTDKDVLDAAKKLSIPVKSHSSSISDLDADKIKDSLSTILSEYSKKFAQG